MSLYIKFDEHNEQNELTSWGMLGEKNVMDAWTNGL